MTSPTQLDEIRGSADTEQALALFDELPPVKLDTVIGQWSGRGVETGNPFDGLLEGFGWYGKRFDSPEAAHPLIFSDRRGLFGVNPAGMPLGSALRFAGLLHNPTIAAAARAGLRLRQTDKPAARLRLVEYRGVSTATMIYDALPINDHFRLADENTLLGVMDMRAFDRPFVFTLHRDGSTR